MLFASVALIALMLLGAGCCARGFAEALKVDPCADNAALQILWNLSIMGGGVLTTLLAYLSLFLVNQ